jgi:hypothetical protein
VPLIPEKENGFSFLLMCAQYDLDSQLVQPFVLESAAAKRFSVKFLEDVAGS